MRFLNDIIKDFQKPAALALATSLICGASRVGLLVITNSALVADGFSWELPLTFIGLCILLLGSAIISETLLVKIAQDCILKLRLELGQSLLATPLRRLQTLGRDRLSAAFSEDITHIAQGLSLLPIVCIDGAMILGCLLYIAWLSWSLLATVIAFMALGALSFQILQYRALNWLHAARANGDGLHSHFRALIEGNKELKMHRRRRVAFFETQVRATAEIIRQKTVQGMVFYTLADHWGNLLFYLAIAAVLFLPSATDLSLRMKIGYVLSVLYLMGPLASLMTSLPGVGRGIAATRNFEAIRAALDTPELKPFMEPPEEFFGPTHTPAPLRLRGIRHRYSHIPGEPSFELGPIDLDITPGELVFLIGGNGSGKTTLAMIILGLYTPDHGELYLGDNLVDDSNRDAYRQHFAAVFADAFLFDSLFGHGEDEAERIHELLGKLQLRHKVTVQNNRFSTLDLSQGQRKRLALLAAYLDDRGFYVFDEWAAEQDPVFKNLFYTELLPELKALGKTVIVITHDDHYYDVADRCLRFESGQIISQPGIGR